MSLVPDFFFTLKDPFGLMISNKIGGPGKRASTASLMVLLQKLRLNMSHELLDYEQVSPFNLTSTFLAEFPKFVKGLLTVLCLRILHKAAAAFTQVYSTHGPSP